MFLRSLHRTEQLTVLQCFDSFTQDISQAREIVWHGRMRGPFCEFSRTLPTNYAVQPDGQIRVIDPCYWTPALPFQYEVLVGTAEHPVEIDSRPSRGDASQLWGIRNLLAHRGNLMLGAKRFVFRGVGLSDEAVFDF